MKKRFAFNTALAIQTAWDMLWAANLKQRAEDVKYEKKHGKRPYDASGTYYITATEIERVVRNFASQTASGESWCLDKFGSAYGVRMQGHLLNTIRSWLQNNRKLTSHNFDAGHISGARYRPVGEPLAPGEQATLKKQAEQRANPRPRLKHYSASGYGGSPMCVVQARRAKGQRLYGFRQSKAWTTRKYDEVTCIRCLNFLKATAADRTAPKFKVEAVS